MLGKGIWSRADELDQMRTRLRAALAKLVEEGGAEAEIVAVEAEIAILNAQIRAERAKR